MTGPTAIPAGPALDTRRELPPSLVAQLCWHTFQLCRALDRGVGELDAALAEATEHADAILELTLAASCSTDPTAGPPDGPAEGRP